VGNKGKDYPSKDISTVNGTGKRSRGLKSCKLDDDHDNDNEDKK
jgi:hypothetical protein